MTRRPSRLAAACLVAAACGGAPGGGWPQADLRGGPSEPIRATTPCAITRVVDGDTVDCEPVGRVRLLGMDTPERGQAPFGALATQALAEMAPPGTEVLFEPDVQARDRYDRALGYLWIQSMGRRVQLNWALVRRGYALVLTYPPNVQYVDSLTSAQAQARAESAGLWARDGFTCAPVDYRARRCGR